MLAYKAWRESRTRFLLSAGALTWFSSLFIVSRPMVRAAASRPFIQFIDEAIYAGSLRNLFVIFVIVFGLGGLLQESSRGTVSFTLSLPVTRVCLVAARAAVGIAEVFALALVPTSTVLAIAPFLGETYSIAEAIWFSAQWAAAGSVLFAGSFMLSICLSGAYASLTASFISLAAYALLVNLSFMRLFHGLNVFALMGRSHPHPTTLAAVSAVAAAMIAAAVRTTERQDF